MQDDAFRGAVGWYPKSGLKCGETVLTGHEWRTTTWHPDGAVASQVQSRLGGDDEARRSSPPWWWGVTDQTERTMPAWMKDDTKWQAAGIETNEAHRSRRIASVPEDEIEGYIRDTKEAGEELPSGGVLRLAIPTPSGSENVHFRPQRFGENRRLGGDNL